MTKADLINFNLMLELNRAMDRNPDLTLQEVVDLVTERSGKKMYINPDHFDTNAGYRRALDKEKSERISNSEMLNLFKKYNDMRDLDAKNYRERNAA